MKDKKVIKLLKKMVAYSGVDLCKFCESLGIKLQYCDCCTDKQCAEEILKYFKLKEDQKKYDRENKNNS